MAILVVKVSGFKLEPESDHYYLTVHDNGNVSYDDYSSSLRHFRMNYSQLTPEQLKTLRERITMSDVRALAKKYDFLSPLQKIATHVQIAIVTPQTLQLIELESSGRPSAQVTPINETLLELVCTIESLRKNSFYRLVDLKTCAQRSSKSTGKQFTGEQNQNAKDQANQLASALLTGDFEKAADLTYPKVISLAGGRERLIATFKAGIGGLKSDKFRITSYVAGEPTQMIMSEGVIYAVVPTTINVKVPEGTMVNESNFIGVSTDGGKTWTFVEGVNDQPGQMRPLFPTVADRLKIPEPKRPTLYRAP